MCQRMREESSVWNVKPLKSESQNQNCTSHCPKEIPENPEKESSA